MKAVILCGGVGSRLNPLTESVPKPMLKIGNRRVIDILINKIIEAGISEIYLSLGYMANEIIEFCENKKYDANIHFVIENTPLGTAGGVKNCIHSSNEDILVLSGDNVFDFDLTKAFDYHFSRDADITICAVNVDDPRDYGVIVYDDDGSIKSFIEKPTWEQATSFCVNTGVYILKGNILDMIPENKFFDFAYDLFPCVFVSDKQFLCYNIDGYWGDMGDFSAYHRISNDILDGHLNNFNVIGTKFSGDTQLSNGAVIIAPCLIGKNTEIKEGCRIGPFCVIGENCVIENNSALENVIMGDNCKIGSMCELRKCILSDHVKLFDNCTVDENTVFAYGCSIGAYSRILGGCRIWPGRRIDAESVISTDMYFETPSVIDFDLFGISGKVFSQITVGVAAKIGQAIASMNEFNRIGVGCDDAEAADIYKNIVKSGIRTCGKQCYDFDKMFKTQAYFYSAYCSLDAFIFISVSGDIINLSFFGKNGMPIERKQSRKINNNYKFSSFSYVTDGCYRDIYNLKLFSTVYNSYFKKILGKDKVNYNVYVESDNSVITDFLEDIFCEKSNMSKSLQILINKSGSEFYIVESGKFYSAERIFTLLCELELAEGKNIIIPETAPSFFEESALRYGGNVVRIYDNYDLNNSISKEQILDSVWCFDPVLMIAKLFNVISTTGYTLDKLFEFQKEFALRKSIIEFDGEAGHILSVLKNCAEKKNNGDVYFVVNMRNGNARLRQLGNANRIRMLVEAADMETAKEIAVFVSEKIKNADIDKGY